MQNGGLDLSSLSDLTGLTTTWQLCLKRKRIRCFISGLLTGTRNSSFAASCRIKLTHTLHFLVALNCYHTFFIIFTLLYFFYIELLLCSFTLLWFSTCVVTSVAFINLFTEWRLLIICFRVWMFILTILMKMPAKMSCNNASVNVPQLHQLSRRLIKKGWVNGLENIFHNEADGKNQLNCICVCFWIYCFRGWFL